VIRSLILLLSLSLGVHAAPVELAPLSRPLIPAAASATPAAPAADEARAEGSLQAVDAAVAALPAPQTAGAESSVAAGQALESALSTDVTADFIAAHDDVQAGRAGPLPEAARQASYRLVRGFLGNHIHDYFRANMERLRELGLDAEQIPVHTEGRRRQALELIERAVREAPHPVVLIGHSRGGTLVHDWYRRASPELKAKVAKLVVMQAPLRGTTYIEWWLSSRWRRFQAAKLGPWVYGVNVLRGLNELTRHTRAWVTRLLPAWQPGDLEKVLTVRTMIKPGVNRFYEKDRAEMARRGEPDSDGRVSAAGGRIEGARDVFLPGVDHQQLVLQRPDARRIRQGYAPHPYFHAGDSMEALVRLLFRQRDAS